MGAWLLKAFSGEQPRISANLLPPNGSQQAVNVRLDDGALDPLRKPEHAGQFAAYPGNYQSIYRYGATWLGWPGAVYAVPGPVATDRLYIMGDGAPKMRVNDTEYLLAVPYPVNALTGSLPANGSRTYAYSYVDKNGVESGPSPISGSVAWNSNRTVTVSGLEDVPTGIVSQNFYRNDGSNWYFVAKRAAAKGDFIDDVTDATPRALPAASATQAPTTAPTVAFDYIDLVVTRVYVYTYVTAFGEESEPCPASNLVDWEPGMTVTLTGFAGDPGGRNIVSQRIYRTQTGDSGTDLYFIAERPVSSADFVDDIAEDAFGEVLPSRAYNAPPDELTGLISMPNGMMAAFQGKDLYLCQPWLPHAWPEAYVLTCDYDIVALGAIGTSLIIMTTGKPYLAQGTDPSSMQMVRLASNLPCVNARGVVDLGMAIAYPSHEGLVLAGADGSAQVVTAQLFNREAWQQFNPGTICAGQLSGRYIASYNSVNPDGTPLVGTFIINTDGSGAFLSRSNVNAVAFHYDVSEGALYYLTSSGEVLHFDAPGGPPLNYYWKSKPLLLSAPENFAVIRVDSDDAPNLQDIANINAARAAAVAENEIVIASPLGSEINGQVVNLFTLAGDSLEPIPGMAKTITVNVYADGILRASATKTGQMLRLPAGFKARKWEIDVYGSARVQQIAMASSVTELKAMAGS
ncbi:hypothetical protein [Bradyrhizobium sp. SZCCHNS1012]|uniref:hypothetical protein n=1 Tax=Bradyrhizobium sp. SZCCHNS1012 TaxID=3057297 RepID=UPI002915C7A1|nr:hypothetical protein [Bradyrhizobium sp. SZCCHNS1012]